MKKLILILLLCLSAQLSAQHAFHHNEIEQKSRLLSRMQSAKPVSKNQQKFDVYYYKLKLEAFPDAERIAGSVQVKAQVIDEVLNLAEIDFVDNMQVDSVIIAGTAASFIHQNNMVKIDLDRSYQSNEVFSFTIFYQGIPQLIDGNRGFDFSTHNSKPIFWTSSEPFEARTWWPCKDLPEDKADSVDIIITVPEGMIVASNGLLFNEITIEGKTTFYWKERYPIATYLVSLAAYEYKLYSDEYITLSGDTMSIDFFVFPENFNNTEFRNNYAQTKNMITAFAGYFGEYPFVKEKYGHAEWGLANSAMEHQTCSSLEGYSSTLIAHELAHQWWGDMITCQDFHHIWLNEGFATYSEALWLEYEGGEQAYHEEISYDAYKGGGTIYVDNASNFWLIFRPNTTYRKPSYVLHMLRHVVGDSTFFDILKAYYKDSRFQHGTADTEDFQLVCEEVSGLKLQKFFQQWIYEEYHPIYEYSWIAASAGTGYKIDMEIKQTQTNTGLFWTPIDVQISTVSGDTTLIVWDSLQTQQFELYVDNEPTAIILDKDNWILKDVEEVVSLPDENVNDILITHFELFDAYPNPFNPSTVIQYQIPTETHPLIPSREGKERSDRGVLVTLKVYDILGREVATLVNEQQKPGYYEVTWNAVDQPSGVYFYQLRSGSFVESKKMVLVR